MPTPIRIAIDVMGGDIGPDVTLAGAEIAAIRHPDTHFELYGHAADITQKLSHYPKLKEKSSVHHTEVSIRMDDKPSQALRYGRGKSSMWMALQSVRDGQTDAAVSAGNTGALMAMARFCLKTLAQVDRPVIAALWPTLRGESIVLDVGASIGADAKDLVTMAHMGAAMARVLFDLDRPTVGLLNVGVEEMKGLEPIKLAGKILKENENPSLDYIGFVEGDDIGIGHADVIVTEGFAGNIALKTAEGTAKQIGGYLKAAMSHSLLSRLGYLLAKSAFSVLKEKLDPRKVNGGVFLGLNGIVIKSHGGTDAEGFAAAIDMAYDMARYGLVEKIITSFTPMPQGNSADRSEKELEA